MPLITVSGEYGALFMSQNYLCLPKNEAAYLLK